VDPGVVAVERQTALRQLVVEVGDELCEVRLLFGVELVRSWRSISVPTMPAKLARITNVSAAEPPASRQRIGTDLYA